MPVAVSTSLIAGSVSSSSSSSIPKDCLGTLPASESVHAVAFNPFEWAAGLVAYGGKKSIIVGEVKLGEEGESEKAVEFSRLSEFHHDGRVEVIAWSPESSLLTYPKVVKFAVASGDKKLKIIHSDLDDVNRCTFLEGHTDYINDVVFLENGHQLASTGDDLTARVWTLKSPASTNSSGAEDPPPPPPGEDASTPEMTASFPLGSPGVALGWHPDDPAKLMVAEKEGVIRFYNVTNQQTILSLDTTASHGLLDRLSSAALCPGNPLLVGGLVSSSGHRLLWDISRSSQPLASPASSSASSSHSGAEQPRFGTASPAHPEGGSVCAFSVARPHLLASVGKMGGHIRVFNIQTNMTVFSSTLSSCRGLSWHARLPLLAVGSDKKVVIWKVEG